MNARALRRTGYTADNGVFYLLQDHLHSASATVSEAGVLTGGYAYYAPFGASRGGQVNLTQKRFTGQYHEATLPGGAGLYDYGARWYLKIGAYVCTLPSQSTQHPTPTTHTQHPPPNPHPWPAPTSPHCCARKRPSGWRTCPPAPRRAPWRRRWPRWPTPTGVICCLAQPPAARQRCGWCGCTAGEGAAGLPAGRPTPDPPCRARGRR